MPVIRKRTKPLKRVDLVIEGKNVNGEPINEKLILLCAKRDVNPKRTVEELEFQTGDQQRFDYYKVLNDHIEMEDCEVSEQLFFDPVNEVYVSGEPVIDRIDRVKLIVEKERELIDLSKTDAKTLEKISDVRVKRLENELEQARIKKAEEKIRELTGRIQREEQLQENLGESYKSRLLEEI